MSLFILHIVIYSSSTNKLLILIIITMNIFSNFEFFVLIERFSPEILNFSKENKLSIFTKTVLNINDKYCLFLSNELPIQKDLTKNEIFEYGRISSLKNDLNLQVNQLFLLKEKLEKIGHGCKCEDKLTFLSKPITDTLPLPNVKFCCKLTENSIVAKLKAEEIYPLLNEHEGIAIKLEDYYLVLLYVDDNFNLKSKWNKNAFINKYASVPKAKEEAVIA